MTIKQLHPALLILLMTIVALPALSPFMARAQGNQSIAAWHDPANLSEQIGQLLQHYAQIKEEILQHDIAKAARDAADRAKDIRDAGIRQWHTSRDAIVGDFVHQLDAIEGTAGVDFSRFIHGQMDGGYVGSGRFVHSDEFGELPIISYDMAESGEMADEFPLDSIPISQAYHQRRRQHQMMGNVSRLMDDMKNHERDIDLTTRQLDALSSQMQGADDSTRWTLQAHVALLEAKRQNRSSQLKIAKLNLDGAVQAEDISRRSIEDQRMQNTIHTLSRFGAGNFEKRQQQVQDIQACGKMKGAKKLECVRAVTGG